MIKILCAALLTACVAFAANAEAEQAFNRGMQALGRADYTEAIEDFTQTINLNPSETNAYVNRGNAYYGLGEYNKALADYNQAINLGSNLAIVYYDRGCAYAKLDYHSKAIPDFNQAIRRYPNFISAYIKRGRSYAELGDYKSATRDARKACELGVCELLAELEKKQAIDKPRAAQIKVPSLRLNVTDTAAYAVGNMRAIEGFPDLFNPVNATQIVCFAGFGCIDAYSYVDDNRLEAQTDIYSIISWSKSGEIIAVNDEALCVTQTLKISQSKKSVIHIREQKSKEGMCGVLEHAVLTSILQ
jgi:hypothetical protein